MKIKKEKKLFAKALFLAMENKSDEEKQNIAKNFFKILKNKKKVYLLPQIFKEFKKYSKKNEVELVLSRDVGIESLERIKNSLKDIFGERKIFIIKIDKNIISGFVAKTNNYLLDASISGVLKNMKSY